MNVDSETYATISHAEPADAAAILTLQKLAYQSKARLYGDCSMTPPRPLDELRGEFESKRFLKATRNGAIIGLRACRNPETASARAAGPLHVSACSWHRAANVACTLRPEEVLLNAPPGAAPSDCFREADPDPLPVSSPAFSFAIITRGIESEAFVRNQREAVDRSSRGRALA